jgi:anti-sigma regulatory factor (Ser/Thr protein kinase)
MFFKVKNYAALQEALSALCAFLDRAEIPKERVFDAKLVACELMSNALKYAGGETGLEGKIKDGGIELKIYSKQYFKLPKTVACADLFAEHGRGLYLVNEICKGEMKAEEDGIRVRIVING